MEKEEFACTECDTEFGVEHYGDSGVQWCPFCGSSLHEEDLILDDEDDE